MYILFFLCVIFQCALHSTTCINWACKQVLLSIFQGYASSDRFDKEGLWRRGQWVIHNHYLFRKDWAYIDHKFAAALLKSYGYMAWAEHIYKLFFICSLLVKDMLRNKHVLPVFSGSSRRHCQLTKVVRLCWVPSVIGISVKNMGLTFSITSGVLL